jgi:hypothetical protein
MTESNIKEYAAIHVSLSTYEERVRLHQAELELAKQKALQRLVELGITSEELTALGL